MDVLAAAANEAPQADEGAVPSPEDDHDPLRGDLPSDMEEGPDDPDEDEDSMPPGNVDACGLDVDDDGDDTTPPAAAADAVEGGQAAERAAQCAPDLPAALATLKNEELVGVGSFGVSTSFCQLATLFLETVSVPSLAIF